MKELATYQDSFGAVNYPEGFESLIEGLSVPEQLKFFRMGCGLYVKHPLNERKKNEYDYSCTIDESEDVKSIIVKDGKIAGVMVKDVCGDIRPCMVERGYIIRDDEELDGSGYKSFTVYEYLICVPEDFDELSDR